MASEASPAPLQRADWISFALLLLIALIWLYRSPYNASGLEIAPDEVEYALAPLQLVETGRYEIMLEGRGLPPRYPPWFAVLVIAPAYLLFGHEPGNAVLPITLMAVAGIGLAWAIGKKLTASASGGAMAALAVLAVPAYCLWSTRVMSDVPCTTLMLVGWVLFLNMRERGPSTPRIVSVGFIVAIAMLFRPVFAAMALPFMLVFWRARQSFLRRAILFGLPIGAAVLATAIYNRTTFGSPSRNGYHFWTPVPYDYPALSFSLNYVPANLSLIVRTALPILVGIALVAWVILRKQRADGNSAQLPNPALAWSMQFLLLTTIPIFVFHLLYFFPANRFYMPMFTGTAIVAGSLVALLLGERWLRLLTVVLPAMLALAIVYRALTPQPPPPRRLAADRIRSHTPENAVVISAIDPVYLQRMAGSGSSRRIVPFSRNVEYASKLLAPRRIDHPNPPPADWHDHRALGLRRGGAQEAVRFVATEQLEAIATLAASGTPLFLDATYLREDDSDWLSRLQARFHFLKRDAYLYELQLQ